MSIRRVIIESPYAADTPAGLEVNKAYARAAMRDSLSRGEAPFASHLLYTQVLDDDVRYERAMGIRIGHAWGEVAHATVVYTDRGISPGMQIGIDDAARAGRTIDYRILSDGDTE
jgi:hypothetical protein